jgi:hypothetical protein
MNILLWVLQILLALYYTMGGIYQLNTEKLPRAWLSVLPKPAWMVLGTLQILFALGLVLPGAARVLPNLTPVAAVCLIVETLSVAVRFTRFPGILWSVVPALLAAFVAYGRIALNPF